MNKELKSIVDTDKREREKMEEAEKYLIETRRNIGAMKEEIAANALLRVKEKLPAIIEENNRAAEQKYKLLREKNRGTIEKLSAIERENKDIWLDGILKRVKYD